MSGICFKVPDFEGLATEKEGFRVGDKHFFFYPDLSTFK